MAFKKYLSIVFVLCLHSLYAQNPSSNQNYIMESVVRDSGVTTLSQLRILPVQGANRNVQYYDGLGRPMQTVQWRGSPEGKDIVQHIEYDGFGRESKKYLPYVSLGIDGSYKAGGSVNVNTFYTKTTGDDISGIVRTPKPYAETVFENSPLDRVLQQGASGEAWQPEANRGLVTTASTTGHTVAVDYSTNRDSSILFWKVNDNGNGATAETGTIKNYYVPGRLYKTVTKDENWVSDNGRGGTVEEYRDFGDRVVLKRVWKSDTDSLSTYYVYDDYGDLCYVIPPGYTGATVTETPSGDFHELVYAYKYDIRRRLIEKKMPGKGWEHIVYNRNDQQVLVQDALQRGKTNKEWLYTKYDAFGRVTESGIFRSNLLRGALQDTLDAEQVSSTTAFWDSRAYNATSYDNRSYPRDSLAKTVLQVNYYDDYGFKTSGVLAATAGLDSTNLVKGLQTGSLVYRENGTLPLLSVNYYDKRGRLIQSASQNHLTGTDYVTNTYSFVGELLTSKREHRATPAGAVTTILTSNEYDHVGRLLETKHYVNDPDNEVTLAKNEYNEIGQLKNKKLHSENNGSTFLSSVAYSYNERGWTTSASAPEFTYLLNYNTGTDPQYNGNISQQLWGHGDTTGNTFSYTYDKMNRLENGTSTGTMMSEILTYDDMGNISTLTRDNGTAINYTYTGNRLTSLSGGLSGSYTYNANGNALTDRTGMAFTYNHLNLPKTATKSGTSVAYLYDASGAKLRKTATVSGTTTQRDYVGGIEYNKVGSAASTIEMIHTEEGYLQNSGGTYTYHYNLTDHLGNVRATLQRTTATTGTVIQKHDYYPFGKSKAIVTSGINKYLYNGKEVQGELGGLLDYGARFYDAEIGRWNVVDPMAEAYYSLTPYQYGGNTPVNTIDIAGKLFIFVNGFIRDRWFSQTERFRANGYGGGQYGYTVQKPLGQDRSIHGYDKFRYWGDVPTAYNETYKDDNNMFISASYTPRSTANLRYNEGIEAGNNLLAQLQSGEMSLSEGETIKIVAHSQGAAYAAGMASVIAKHSKYGGLLEFVDYISPHQPKDVKHPKGVKGRQFSTKTDIVSSKNNWFMGSSKYGEIKGAEWGVERESYKGGHGGHSVDTWLDDLVEYFRNQGVTVNDYR